MAALGTIVGHSSAVADMLVGSSHLSVVLDSLCSESKPHRKASLFVIKNLAKLGDHYASIVLADSRALPGILTAMADSDTAVKESAVWALGYIVKQSPALATSAIEAGCLPIIRQFLEGKEVLPLRRISISLLGDVAKHSEQHADHILQLDLVSLLLDFTNHDDMGMRKQSTACLSQLLKHSLPQASQVSSCSQFHPTVNRLLKDPNDTVRRNACIILRDLCEKDLRLSTDVVEAGTVPSLGTLVIESSHEDEKLAAISCLGHIASHSPTLAKTLITSNLVPSLCNDLINTSSESIRLKLIWCLGEVGKHNNDNCKSLNDHGLLTRLLALSIHANSSEELRSAAKGAFGKIVENTTDCQVLESLLKDVPTDLQTTVLHQLAKILPNNMEAKKQFVQSGSLQRVIAMHAKGDESIQKSIGEIQACFPTEILEFFKPSHVSLSHAE